MLKPVWIRGRSGGTMRTHQRTAGLAVIALLAFGSATARAEDDTRYWPLREINFPVPLDRISAGGMRPSVLRFYVRAAGKSWEPVAALAPDQLELIDRDANRRGFRYSSPSDGAFEFCLQAEYRNGDRRPADADLRPEYRVVFDTRPPSVMLNRVENVGIEWDVSDENLVDDGIRIEARWIERNKVPERFVPLRPRGLALKPRGSFRWSGIQRGEVLEVRVVAQDRAGLETASPPVQLSVDGSELPSEEFRESFNGTLAASRGGVDANRPVGIEYSASKNLNIVSKVSRVTRSGVAKSYLWWRTAETTWTRANEKPESITPDTRDPQILWPYTAPADGRYGFIVIPENGAGGRDPDPRPEDPAQFLIEVDTTPPRVSDVVAEPRRAPAGPRVEVTWKAADKNLSTLPVRIESGSTPSGPWELIHPDRPGGLPNTGHYTWDVPNDFKDWKFFVRVVVADLAGNSTPLVTTQEVKIDLETPKAVIEKVTAAGGRSQVIPDASPLQRTQNTAPDVPGLLPTTTVTDAPPPAPSGVLPPTPPPALPAPAPSPDRNDTGGPVVPILPANIPVQPPSAPDVGSSLPGVTPPSPPGS